MNKFSKVTGLIAFWVELSLIIAIILLIFFQKSIAGIYFSSLDEYKDIFIVPWQEIIKNFIFLFLLGIFCLKSNSNKRVYGILILYFYILITIIFDNPFSASTSFIAMSKKGVNYLAFFSAFNSAQNSILYIFILIRNISFILSAGSMIVKNESRYLEVKNDENISRKSRTSLILYSAFLGFLGIDRFYIGRTVIGIGKLLLGLITITEFFFVFRYWYSLLLVDRSVLIILLVGFVSMSVLVNSIDFILAALGRMKDSEKKLVRSW
ncbi:MULTISPECIES: TM2 domain-containing protein [unclassified Treponema]|uniref:TM2 domain-containing protein n=1 Tax=unclassified Treponema TaxID=2638727 RepID=UPI0020A36771|nr:MULTISPECIES: TM2 domain-containing protein [unclassified Treponema]UTC67814.1 TM2 domain-containing protein [Treponema sp. OMZ 789]UTC70539.1 TM2 domain-containing protein [Treponema sp. OMZ 790]UTC73251.1 TM2 domain-containing protein [Treponema sp. OMZ 791]